MSLYVAFSTALNRYSNDTQNKVKIYRMVYVSEALLSLISGIILGTIPLAFNMHVVWSVLGAATGAFMGKNTLNAFSKVALTFLGNKAKVDLVGSINLNDEKQITPEEKCEISSTEVEIEKLIQEISDSNYTEEEKQELLNTVTEMKKIVHSKRLDKLKKGINNIK